MQQPKSICSRIFALNAHLYQLPLNSPESTSAFVQQHLDIHRSSQSSSWVCSIAPSNVTVKDIPNWRVDSPNIFYKFILHLDGEMNKKTAQCVCGVMVLVNDCWLMDIPLNESVTGMCHLSQGLQG